jgi:hypothetical protein
MLANFPSPNSNEGVCCHRSDILSVITALVDLSVVAGCPSGNRP